MHLLKKNSEHKKEKLYISPQEAKTLLNQQHIILVDVRTEEEFYISHIEHALLLPVQEFDFLIEDVFPDKSKTYILYCRSGIRSAYAQRIMKSKGYQTVYDLGGILDWPYQTIKGI
jgi:phage shock protein E